MRDYLYIWNDPASQFIIASGIEFRDIAGYIRSDAGLVLLEHDGDFFTDDIKHGRTSYIPRRGIAELAEQDHCGNFSWVDCASDSFPALSDQEIAQLLFFTHMRRPLERMILPSLGNKYLCYIHDDGWYLKLYYSSWTDVATFIGTLYPQLNLLELQSGRTAYWLSGTSVETEELTFNIDAILNRRR